MNNCNQKAPWSGSPFLSPVCNHLGTRWDRYRENLKPIYLLVWLEIAFCYLMMAGSLIGYSLVISKTATLILFPFATVSIGFWLQAISCFGHEATHFNVASCHKTNDLLANSFILSLIGVDIKNYRHSHWQHHHHLGNIHDSEVSYHNHLTLGFIFKGLTGIQALSKLIKLNRNLRCRSEKETKKSIVRGRVALIRTALIHFTIIGFLFLQGLYAPMFAWIIGIGMIFPFFGSIRQVLEHRSFKAKPELNYSIVNHDPTNRMFSNGFFSRYFGSAGFNKHLLHHWDPLISYTRFPEMEHFFLESELAPNLKEVQTTYLKTFLTLLRKPHE